MKLSRIFYPSISPIDSYIVPCAHFKDIGDVADRPRVDRPCVARTKKNMAAVRTTFVTHSQTKHSIAEDEYCFRNYFTCYEK